MPSYQYRDSHYKDDTVVRPSYLYQGNLHTGKMASLYWISPLIIPAFFAYISSQIGDHYNVLYHSFSDPEAYIHHERYPSIYPIRKCEMWLSADRCSCLMVPQGQLWYGFLLTVYFHKISTWFSLKGERRHFHGIFIIGCTDDFDNFWCSQW